MRQPPGTRHAVGGRSPLAAPGAGSRARRGRPPFAGLFLLLALATGACSESLTPPPGDVDAGSDLAVAFLHRPPGAPGRDLRVAGLDGSPARTVAGPPRHPDVVSFAVSSTAPRLAFVRDTVVDDFDLGSFHVPDIFLTGIEGAEERNLTRARDRLSPGDPFPLFADLVWSPDGSRIAYSRLGERWDILIIGTDGSPPANLTDSEEPDRSPAWSPDGARIAYLSLPLAEEGWQLRIVNAGGGSPPRAPTEGVFWATVPAWSPDGTLLAFSATLEPDPDAPTHLFLVSPNGGDRRELTIAEPEEAALELLHPSWHPDGDRLAVTAVVGRGADGSPRTDVVILDRSGSLSRRIDLGPSDAVPRFSPDGRYVAFTAKRDGRTAGDIHVLELASGEMRVLTESGINHSPRWIRRR